ncbi:hypothetical protein ABK040_002320 [Willaertia magna]
MELIQDLQKHFQSIVMNINNQYGSMNSMKEFFDKCREYVCMLNDFAEIYEICADYTVNLERRNEEYKKVIIRLGSIMKSEFLALRSEISSFKQVVSKVPNTTLDSFAELYQCWLQATGSLEKENEKVMNHMWKSNVEITNKNKLLEKENKVLKQREKEIEKLKEELTSAETKHQQELCFLRQENENLKIQLKSLERKLEENSKYLVTNEEKEKLQNEVNNLSKEIEHVRQSHQQQLDIREKEYKDKLHTMSVKLKSTYHAIRDVKLENSLIKEKVNELNTRFSATILGSDRYGTIASNTLLGMLIVVFQKYFSPYQKEIQKLKKENQNLQTSLNETLSSYSRLKKMKQVK